MDYDTEQDPARPQPRRHPGRHQPARRRHRARPRARRLHPLRPRDPAFGQRRHPDRRFAAPVRRGGGVPRARRAVHGGDVTASSSAPASRGRASRPIPVPLQEEVATMELHERLVTTKPAAAPPTKEPFADLKNSIHMLVIGELGPQLTGQAHRPGRDARSRHRRHPPAPRRRDRHLPRRPRAAHAPRSPTTSSATGRSSGCSPTTRSRRSWSTGPSEIWIERQGRLYETTVRFSDDSHLRRIINRMVAQIGRRIDESSPMVDARLPDGSRVNAIIAPLSLSGPLLTIRKFSRKRLGLQDMVNLGSLSEESVDFLRRCIQAQLNVLISGGTGSGKTTLLNALSSGIPDHERIVTIEDAAELQLHQRHVLRLEARPPNIEGEGAIPIRDLVRNSLRMRPDRIIVGECRGAEALDMLQAMNTGHDGSLSTVHANSPRDALARLETMVLMAGYDLPVRAIRQQVSSALDMIVHIERHGGRLAPRHGDHRGAADGVRRDHAPGHLRVQDRVVRARRDDQRGAQADGAAAGLPRTSSRSAASSSRPACSRTGRSRRTSRTSVDEAASLDHSSRSPLARRCGRRDSRHSRPTRQPASRSSRPGTRSSPTARTSSRSRSRAESALTTADVTVDGGRQAGREPRGALVRVGARDSARCS